MPDLSIGDSAPDFELPITMEKMWKLSENIGDKNIILAFFPMAYSSTCQEEMCSLRDGISEFQTLDAKVVGISVDNPFVLKKWKDELGLPFELLSDFNKTASQAYGAFHYELGPLLGVAKRSVFVVDKEGIIRYRWVSEDPGTLPDLDEIKKALDEIK